MSNPTTKILYYSLREIHDPDNDVNIDFDGRITKEWSAVEKRVMLPYSTENITTATIPGKYNFITQLNPMRKATRRKPSLIKSLQQDFDKSLFNFTKIKPEEVLFKIVIAQDKSHDGFKNSSCEAAIEATFIINSAPICPYHSLIVPKIESCQPQVLNYDSLMLALQILRISSSRFLRVGFNSLGAMASVNHLHFHSYYLNEVLPIENAKCVKLNEEISILSEYFVPGFVFELQKDMEVVPFLQNVMSFVDVLLENELCHNFFMTRVRSHPTDATFTTIRLCIWARNSTYGEKDIGSYSAALCELAGHIPIYEAALWGKLTEEEIVDTLSTACKESYDKVLKLYKIEDNQCK